MEENQPPKVDPNLFGFLQAAAIQQALAKATGEHGLDTQRLWASIIGLLDDPALGVTTLIFRDGAKSEVTINVGPDNVQTQTHEMIRPVVTIVLPRATVKEFLRGALEHMESQDKIANVG